MQNEKGILGNKRMTRREFLRISGATTGLMASYPLFQLALPVQAKASMPAEGPGTYKVTPNTATAGDRLYPHGLKFVCNVRQNMQPMGGIKIQFPVGMEETISALWAPLNDPETGKPNFLVKLWGTIDGSYRQLYENSEFRIDIVNNNTLEIVLVNWKGVEGDYLRPIKIKVKYPLWNGGNIQKTSTYYRQDAGLAWKVYSRRSEGAFEIMNCTHPYEASTRIDSADFERVLVFLPADVTDDHFFEIAVVALDQYGNRCTHFQERVSFPSPANDRFLNLPKHYDFTYSDGGIHVFDGVLCRHDQSKPFVKATVEINGIRCMSNACRIHVEEPDYRIFFGDLHFHSSANLDDSCCGGDHRGEYVTPEETYRYAAEVMRLDFAAISEHDHVFCRTDNPDQAWKDFSKKVSTDISRETGLVTFYGYEWTNKGTDDLGNPCPGHRTVLYKEDENDTFFASKDRMDEWNTLDDLFRSLDEKTDVLVIPHVMNPNFRPWSSDPDDVERANEYQRVGEIYSHKNNGRPALFECQIHKAPFPEHSYRYAWSQGHEIGLIGSTDNHLGQAGASAWTKDIHHAGGLAAVLAENTGTRRDSIWNAFNNRQTYATTGEKAYLRFSIDDYPMGSQFHIPYDSTHALKVRIEFAASEKYDPQTTLKVNLFRLYNKEYTKLRLANIRGNWFYINEFELAGPTLSSQGPPEKAWCMYYLKAKIAGRKEVQSVAWSSPIWIKGTSA